MLATSPANSGLWVDLGSALSQGANVREALTAYVRLGSNWRPCGERLHSLPYRPCLSYVVRTYAVVHRVVLALSLFTGALPLRTDLLAVVTYETCEISTLQVNVQHYASVREAMSS